MATTSADVFTKTIAGIAAELTASSGITPSYDTSITLNAKYGIAASQVPAAANRPVLRYFGIGIKGSYNSDGGNLTSAYTPDNTNLDLYQAIPFRVVPLANDLSAAERALYRLRVPKRINNIDYVLYYLKVMTLIDDKIQITQTDPVTLEETTYTLDPTNLNPTPTIPTSDGVVGTNTTEINVTSNFQVAINATEILEAINILFDGDLRYAKLTEFGLYYGSDVTVSATNAAGSAFTYTESIMTQLAFHRCYIGDYYGNSSTSTVHTIRLGNGDVSLLSSAIA